MNYTCKFENCGAVLSTKQAFTEHLKKHDIQQDEYLVKYELDGMYPQCPFCQNKRKFRSLWLGFRDTCCSKTCRNELNRQKILNIPIERKKEIVLKRKQTCLDRYGEETYCNKEKIRESLKAKTQIEREAILNKSKQTCMEKYGKDWFSQTDDWLNKSIKSNREKFGYDWVTQTEDFKAKMSTNESRIETMKNTNMNRYGADSFSKTTTFVEKLKATNNEKYGVDFTAQSLAFAKNRKHKFEYDGKTYDSNLEIEFVKILNKFGLSYSYHPCCFDYLDSNGNKHRYFPDFEVNGKLYEIKGSYLLKEGELFFPYRNGLTKEELEIIDDIYRCKFECMKQHDVVILSEKDIQKIKENIIFEL